MSNFKYQAKLDLPKLKNIKTEWDLKKLYYKSDKDPQIEKDLKFTERQYKKFIAKWKKKDFTKNANVLAEALTEKQKLAGKPESSRVSRYYSLRLAVNVSDQIAKNQFALLTKRFRKLQDEMLFFSLTLGKVPKTKQREFLKDPVLAPFAYYLEQVFKNALYDLTEDQEKIINLKGSQSYSRWVSMTEEIISNRSVTWQKKQLPIPEALATIDTLKKTQKNKLWLLIIAEMKQIAEVAEHEFNAIITDVRTEDELRGYKKPYSSTALAYEDDEKSIETLVSVVSDKGFKLSQKFYKLKAAYHGVKKLPYVNKYDPLGTAPVIPFAQAVDICRDVFHRVSPTYGEVFDHMLTQGQIDVYPRKGKRGGAFMSDQVGHPTHVFLNHLENFSSLETLAHEMGHAIHATRSKTQPTFYQGHSITTAETASTLFENLVFDAVYEQVPEKNKITLLHDRITRDISTIQRQIAFFNAELEIHNTISKQGAMNKEELSKLMAKHLRSYLGPAIDVTDDDGYSYVYIPHLRYGFYVYTYAYGLLMSTIMANHYKADSTYVEKIDTFLRSGASASVPDIFKSIGINPTKPDTFKKALGNQAADIAQFRKFATKQTK